nr:TMV resistance protein N-like [Tanacetum cinerariifolium]
MEATEEVRTIGIHGMGGIGKTTIARVLYHRISCKFMGSSFISGVREKSSTPKDICALQKNILKDTLGARYRSRLLNPEDGAEMIQTRLCNKKVLLVLDDVDDSEQLEFLAESNEWFGPGSRIIITTRDVHLLSHANARFVPALLRMDQAVELFSWHAFREKNPPNGYKNISNRAIRYTDRLPLALKVLGSFLCGREASVWESALNKLAKMPNRKIFNTLKLSFDYLDDVEKQIFLHIACFFKGQSVIHVTEVLDSLDIDTEIGISVLIEKSLITVSHETLGMHDLIQEMGRKIVSESFPGSRLWLMNVIRDLIKKNKVEELHAIEAIVVPWIDPDQGLPADVFENMKNLRLLDVDSVFTCGEPTSLPDELQWFSWSYYPFASLPEADMHKLVGLELGFSEIRYLWNGHKNMLNLRFIYLDHSNSLIRFPDVSGTPNVEILDLSNCENLEEVDESLGYLRRLRYLVMSECSKLKCLPSRLEMESLEMLVLNDCESLERFPELSPCMAALCEIDLSNCSKIEELPSSIEYLCNLSSLNLSCTSLMYIPHSICELKCLIGLNLIGCHELQNLPDEFGRMENLQELHLKLPASVSFHVLNNLCSLRKLDLSGSQIRDKDFPDNLNGLFLLEELSLRWNNRLLELPASITHLTHLKTLDISGCDELQIVRRLPSGIQVLDASYCRSLRKIENLSEGYIEWLHNITLYDCEQLLEDAESEKYLDTVLKETFLTKYAAVDSCVSICVPGNTIPSWFEDQQDGSNTALKLPPNWQTQITGFAISAVYSPERQHNIDPCLFLIFEDDGMLVTTTDIDCINACSRSEKGNLWVGYVPFSLFEQLNDHGEDWSNVFGGNLLINICFLDNAIIRCGAKVVYKEVESTQQTKPSIPFYWNWKLSQSSQNTFECKNFSEHDKYVS